MGGKPLHEGVKNNKYNLENQRGWERMKKNAERLYQWEGGEDEEEEEVEKEEEIRKVKVKQRHGAGEAVSE